MKHKELQQIKDKPRAELEKILAERRDQLWSLRKDLVSGKVKNVKEVKKTRKVIAQILTAINQKHE